MRTTLLSLAAAMGVALATPAFGQGFYVGGPGVSVGVGSGYHGYRHRWVDRPYFRRHYGAYAYSRGCRDITIRRPGMVKRIHRCD